jgi:hypothetical protein
MQLAVDSLFHVARSPRRLHPDGIAPTVVCDLSTADFFSSNHCSFGPPLDSCWLRHCVAPPPHHENQVNRVEDVQGSLSFDLHLAPVRLLDSNLDQQKLLIVDIQCTHVSGK